MTKTLIKLHRCASWSGPLQVAYIKIELSRNEGHKISVDSQNHMR